VIVEYSALKETFPKFQSLLKAARDDLIANAKASWPNLEFGGMTPRAGQFGESTIMPELFQDISGNTMVTWNQWLNATGHQTIMRGAASGGRIYEDYKVALVGIAFLDKAIRLSEIRMQISDRKLPRVNIEEAMAYEKPAVVFEDYFILDEETGFDLYAYVLSQGPQRIKLIGTQVNRVPNKMQTTNVGAALT